jgi:hypothetical protein
MKPRIQYIKHEPGHYDIVKDGKVVGSVSRIAYRYGIRYEATCLKHELCACEGGDKFVRLFDAKASNCEHIPIYGRIEEINTCEMKLVNTL